MIKRLLPAIFACIFFASCKPSTVIKFDHPDIHYVGRVGMKTDAAELMWTASSVVVNFNGTGASATLNDSKGTDLITVVVDGKVMQTLQPKKNKQKLYKLVSGLSPGNHRLELFKRTEFQMGTLSFFDLHLEDEGKMLPPPVYAHSIEFYADSITCGYAMEDPSGTDKGDYGYENGYLAYANLVARRFDAEYYNISKSGIGVTVSWFPYILPEIYARTYPLDPKSTWDFSKFTPEIVVVNLFQNDYHLVNNLQHAQFKARFGDTPPTPEFIVKKYQDFIGALRDKYPKAKIICAIGSMDSAEPSSPFPGYIKQAVAAMGDKDIYTQVFPYLGERRHPNVREHQQMANQLSKFIETKFGWQTAGQM